VLEEAGAGVVSVAADAVVVVVGNAWEGEEEAVGDVVGVGADAARMYGLGNLSDRIQGQVQVQALAPGSHSHSHLDLVQAQSQNQPQEHQQAQARVRVQVQAQTQAPSTEEATPDSASADSQRRLEHYQ
jgi:hypothetical protein